MRFDVMTLMPELVHDACRWGVVGRGIERGLLQVEAWNPRDWADNAQRRVDDRPYGGGPGMVMQVAPLRACLAEIRQVNAEPVHVVAMSPQGRRLCQQVVERLARCRRLVLVCGRYQGIDERFLDRDVDEHLSIGDYVLSGGELPALVVMDAIARRLPGVLGCRGSADIDSFADGLLAAPDYTRPEMVDGDAVPEVLLSGDHAAIRRWRMKQSLGRTWAQRPDLLEGFALSAEQAAALQEYIQEYIDEHRGRSGPADATDA